MYDLKYIMSKAWEIRKDAKVSMSVALKSAWAIAKTLDAAEKAGKGSDWNYKVVCNNWVKAGRNRTYISTRIYTNAWNCKKEISFGYVDNMTGKLIAA